MTIQRGIVQACERGPVHGVVEPTVTTVGSPRSLRDLVQPRDGVRRRAHSGRRSRRTCLVIISAAYALGTLLAVGGVTLSGWVKSAETGPKLCGGAPLLTAHVIKAMRRLHRFVGVQVYHMGAVDSAVYRARRTSSAPAVTRQVSARTRSDEGGFPGCVARTSSPRVHGSGAVTCRTRARWDRAHQGYAGPARGRTSTSITRSWAPSLRSERAVAPANPGELCSFTASRFLCAGSDDVSRPCLRPGAHPTLVQGAVLNRISGPAPEKKSVETMPTCLLVRH